MNIINQYIIGLCLLLWIASCANRTSPTGGPKDEEPPILISSIPTQGTLNYQGSEIQLNFNEFIKINDPKNQIIITPRIKEEYDIKYRKNKVIIKLEKPLRDSTTYTFNFREAIQDITEGNAPKDLKLIFSTGPFLDSLSITGRITNLLKGEPLEDISVSLYDANDTLNIFNNPPIYLTKTNKEGQYILENIKNGAYQIYAFKDDNKNLTAESKSEKYGFKQKIQNLDSNIMSTNIPIQHLDIRDFKIQSTRQSGTTYNIKANKYIVDYQLKTADTAFHLFNNYTDKNQNTIQIFKTFPLVDSLTTYITLTDSVGNILQDTLYLKFEPTERKPVKFTTIVNIKKIIPAEPLLQTEIVFNKPVISLNQDSIYVFLDSLHIDKFSAEEMTWNKNKDTLKIRYNIDKSLFELPEKKVTTLLNPIESKKENVPSTKPKKTINPYLYIGESAFISVENDSSTITKKELIFIRKEQLGTILGKVTTDKKHYIIQLLNKQYKVIAERYNEPNFRFDNQEPGEYRIRVIIDSNENGKWDLGNIIQNIEPETCIFYKSSEGEEKLILRANWELGPNVISF